MKKIVADIAAEVLKENGATFIRPGDHELLDLIAARADEELGTNLSHSSGEGPRWRFYERILTALWASRRGKQLFTKAYESGENRRIFTLRE